MTSAFNFPYKTAEPQLSLCRFSEDSDSKSHASVTCHDEPWLELESADLWRQFDSLTTEMVITKSGRRLFPAIKVKVHDLDPSGKFVFVLDIVPVDNLRYKFQESRWTVAGPACVGRSCLEDVATCTSCTFRGTHQHIPDVSLPRLTSAAAVPIYYVHPDSPTSGQQWMSKAVSFHRLKLTNSGITDQYGHVVLSSMRRYQPRVHLFQLDEHVGSCCNDQLRLVKTFIFLETQFIAVTAYQNNKITRLKIDNNPFAKGFRENDKDNERKLTKNFPNADCANLQSYMSPTLTSGVMPLQARQNAAVDIGWSWGPACSSSVREVWPVEKCTNVRDYDDVNVPTSRPYRVNNCRQTDGLVKSTPQVLSALVSFFDNDAANIACDSRKREDVGGQIVRPRPLRLSTVISSFYRYSVSSRFSSSLGTNTEDIWSPEFRIDAARNAHESVMQTRLSDRRQDAEEQSESRDYDVSNEPWSHLEHTSTKSCYSGGGRPIRPVPLRIRSTPYQP